jgi:hypothetical protein
MNQELQQLRRRRRGVSALNMTPRPGNSHRVARRPSVFGAGRGIAGVSLALAVLWPATAVAEEPARKDVLLLYADSMLLPANVVADRELRSSLGADAATPVRFYSEALDLSWFPDKEVERAMLDLLRAKYANRNLALVIPVGPPALRFALLHRATIFPGGPLVFVAAREAVLADLPLPPDVTGMWMDRDWRANVELILRLHPDTRRIAFVSGGGTTPSTAVEFKRVAASYRDRFEPIELTDRTFEEMLKEAAALPEHTVILVGLFLRPRRPHVHQRRGGGARRAHRIGSCLLRPRRACRAGHRRRRPNQ